MLKNAPLEHIFVLENKERRVARLCKVDQWEPSEGFSTLSPQPAGFFLKIGYESGKFRARGVEDAEFLIIFSFRKVCYFSSTKIF